MGFQLYSMHDLDSSEGTVQLHDEDGRLIYHPTPVANDPNDPLRWPKWKKLVCFFSVCSFAFLTNYGLGGLTPASYVLSLEFNKSQNEVIGLTLWPILILGMFNFFWVPLSNYLGKRPVFVFSTLVLAFAILWGALATSFESLLWSNNLAAFAGSASEAVAASIVNDTYFLHQRANLMGWYMNAISAGNTIGTIICGFIVTHAGWRVHKWHTFGLVFLNFLLVLFFVPETRYDRSFSPSKQKAFDASLSDNETVASEPQEPDQPVSVASTASSSSLEKTFSHTVNDVRSGSQSMPSIPKKTYLQELGLWSGVSEDSNIFKMFFRPILMLCYPAVIFAFVCFAVNLAWVIAINVLNSFVLQQPPYNMKPDINGLINVPGLVGNVLGSWVGGWVVDRYSDWRSTKNNGIFQPETRLHLLVVPALIVPAGCLLFGYGVADQLHWSALFIANGMVSFGLNSAPTMLMTYVSDCYMPVNADALTAVIGLKNVVAFGFAYGLVPWVTSAGYVSAFGTQAGLYVLITLFAVPFVIWGQKIRHVSARWRIVL